MKPIAQDRSSGAGTSLALLERDVLAAVVRDEPFGRALELLVLGLERRAASGMLGSILLLGDDGCLHHGAAPHLAQSFMAGSTGNRSVGPLARAERRRSCARP